MPLEPDPNAPPTPEEDRGSLTGAAVKTLGTSAFRDIVAPAGELVNEATGGDQSSGMGAMIARHARRIGTAIDETIPAARLRDRDAKFFPGPGEQSVFEHPGSSLVMKGAEMALPAAAVIATGGEAVPLLALGAAQGAGGYLSQTAGTLESQSDEQLAQQFPDFAKNLDWGLSSADARRLLLAQQRTPGALAMATAGGAAQNVLLGGGLRGTSSILRKTAVGAGEGGLGMGIGGGATDAATQLGEISSGKRQQFDFGEAAHAIAEGAATGTFVGGAIGGASAVHQAVTRPRVEAPPVVPGEVKVGEGNTPDPAEASALAAAPPPETRTQAATGPKGLDEQIASRQQEIDAAATPPTEVRSPAAQGTTPEGPTTPVPIPPTAGGRTPFDVAGAIHEIASKNTRYREIEAALHERMAEAGAQPPSYAELQTTLRDMAKRGELVYNEKRGYRSNKEPPVAPEAAAIPPDVRTPPVAPEIPAAIEAARPAPPAEGAAAAPQPVVEVPRPVEPAQVIPVPTPRPSEFTVAPGTKPKPFVMADDEPVVRKGPSPQAPKPAVTPVTSVEPRKPRVLAAPVSAEVRAARVAAAAEAAAAGKRATNAERMRESRQKAHGANDERARKVIEEQWTNEHGVEDHAAINEQDAKAFGGDVKSIEGVIARAKRIDVEAQNAGVATRDIRTPTDRAGRSTFRKAEPDAKNLTPWTNFVRQATAFHQVANAYLRGKMTPERMRMLTKHVQTYIESEAALRRGDFEGANAAQRAKNIAGKEVSSDAIEPKFKRGDTAVSIQTGIEGIHAPEGVNSSAVHEGMVAPKPFWDALNEAKPTPVRSLLNREVRRMRAINDPVAKRVAGVMQRLMDLVGDTPVIAMKGDAFETMASGGDGVWLQPTAKGFVEGHNGTVVLHGERGMTIATAMHEATHAVVSRELERNAPLRLDVQKILDEVKSKWEGDPKEYGLTDVHEFLAEAMSNPDFQMSLQGITLSRPVSTRWGQVKDAWNAFVSRVAEHLGFKSRGEKNALEAAMLAFDEASAHNDATRHAAAMDELLEPQPRFSMASDVGDRARSYFEERRGATSEWKLRTRKMLDKVTTLTQLGNMSDHLFGEEHPARRLTESMLKAGASADKLREDGAPLVRDLANAGRRFTPETWREFEDFLHDETSAGVYGDRPLADQKHLGKNAAAGLPGKALYAEMERRYNALPAELQALRSRLHEFFKQRQDEMSLSGINNILKLHDPTGVGSTALARRILDGKMTAADNAVIGTDAVATALKNMRKLASIDGPYVPLMRRGDFVVQGRHELAMPAKAVRRLNDAGDPDPAGHVFDFANEADANQFLAKDLNGLHADAERVYVDPTTGLDHYIDPVTGKKEYLTSAETNADEHIRVTVQDRHVEFHERLRDAKQAREQLVASGLKDVPQVDIKRFNAAEAGANFMPTQIQNMINALEKRANFKALDKGAQAEMIRHLNEMGIASMSSTRAQTRRLPRTNVAGANHDITTNTQHYNSSSAGYLGRLKHQPETDKYLKQMQEFTDEQAKTNAKEPDEDAQVMRRSRLQEFEQRVYGMRDPEPNTLFNRVGTRFLQMSMLDKLASPAFHVINGMQPAMVTAPVLVGRHGFKALAAIKDAYSTIGGMRTLGAGIRDTISAARGSREALTDYTKSFKDRVVNEPDGPELVKFLDHLRDTNLLARDAGMELGKVINPSGNLAGRALDRADMTARQVGSAIESINRAVTGVAAYRLERSRGASIEEATKYAHETVHDTQGDYSSLNTAPAFKGPVARIALQFKKYPQLMYYLLGKQATAAFKGDTQAMKTFVALMATHSLAAGVLGGVPFTEAIKLGMLAAGLAGLTDKKYADVEQDVRAGAAGVFGKAGGEIFTRGIPRYLGVDIASRVGLDNLILGGQDPKSMKADDLWAFLGKTFAGAPAGYIMDAVQGAQAASRGDYWEAARLMVPIKTFADSVAAYQMATVGRQSASGRQLMDPITLDQAIVKALGFQPGAVAEAQEQTFAIRGDIKARTEKRNQLVGQWVGAKPADKQSIWQDILAWNKGQPQDARISMGDLTKAMYSRKKQESSGTYKKGISYNKRTRDLEGANSFYNVP